MPQPNTLDTPVGVENGRKLLFSVKAIKTDTHLSMYSLLCYFRHLVATSKTRRKRLIYNGILPYYNKEPINFKSPKSLQGVLTSATGVRHRNS